MRQSGNTPLRLAAASAASTAVLLGACSLAPRYEPPPTQPVEHFAEAGDWMPAQPADRAPRGAWWEAFGEPTLDTLEQRLSQANPDLQAAVARFAEARAVALRAYSDVLPSVDAH